MDCFFVFLSLLKKTGHTISLAHVFLSSVTFTFPINNLRLPWSTFLKLCPHICPGQQRNSIDFWVTVSKVKVIGVKCAKTVSGCLSNNFTKWISSSYICVTYFELTFPVVQNICDKKNLYGALCFTNISCYHRKWQAERVENRTSWLSLT